MSDIREARFSPCRRYRYSLKIVDGSLLNDRERLVMFIGLNPSTADEFVDDPTVRRCRAYARAWGYNGIIMTNLFAFRATDPDEMMAYEEPVGEESTALLYLDIAAECAHAHPIAAWGIHGAHRDRADEIKAILNLDCLRLNKDGSPCHPLYLPKTLTPKPFNYSPKEESK